MVIKDQNLKFFIVDKDGKQLEDPIMVHTTSPFAVKNYLLDRYSKKYGEGNFKVKYTSKF